MKGVLLGLLLVAGCEAPIDDADRDKQLLVITIDAEALISRADTDHVQRLIYGDFGPGQREGIDEMMDAADRHGVKLTFFLDVLGERTHPGEIAEVGQHIVARGHDLELHTHPEQMPDEFWTEIGVEDKPPETYTRDDAAALLGECARIMADWDVPPPIAYRAGGYLYSAGMVVALPDAGFTADYDYNFMSRSQADTNVGELPVFRWENDLVEVPIAYVDQASGPDRFDDFTYLEEGFGTAYNDIRRFQDTHADNVLTLMMHSWSLLTLNEETRHFEYGGDAKEIAFDTFLDGLPGFVEVVTARELDSRIAAGELPIDTTETTEDVFSP